MANGIRTIPNTNFLLGLAPESKVPGGSNRIGPPISPARTQGGSLAERQAQATALAQSGGPITSPIPPGLLQAIQATGGGQINDPLSRLLQLIDDARGTIQTRPGANLPTSLRAGVSRGQPRPLAPVNLTRRTATRSAAPGSPGFFTSANTAGLGGIPPRRFPSPIRPPRNLPTVAPAPARAPRPVRRRSPTSGQIEGAR